MTVFAVDLAVIEDVDEDEDDDEDEEEEESVFGSGIFLLYVFFCDLILEF